MELAATGNVAAIFLTMSNELVTSKILKCPADTGRQYGTNFTAGFGSQNISYFVGLDASDENPASILVGDDNFELDDEKVKPGVLELWTNMPVAWSRERHQFKGNIALSDGTVHTMTTSELKNAMASQYKSQWGAFTNRFRFAIP